MPKPGKNSIFVPAEYRNAMIIIMPRHRLRAVMEENRKEREKKKEKDATEEAEPKKEVTIEDIAKGAGFPSMRAMKKAAKQRYGMNIHELRKVIKI